MPSPNAIGIHGSSRPAAVSLASQCGSAARALPRLRSMPDGQATLRGRGTSHVRAPAALPAAITPPTTRDGVMLLPVRFGYSLNESRTSTIVVLRPAAGYAFA